MNYAFRFAGQPEPTLTVGASRDWNGFSARRVRSTPGRFPGGGRDEHQVVIYLTPGVESDCACDGVRSRRVGSPYEFDLVPAGATGFWEDFEAMDMVSIRFDPARFAETAEALGVPADLAPALGARDALIAHIGRALEAELEAPHGAGRLYGDSLAQSLMVRLLQTALPTAPGRPLLSKPHARRVVDYIEANLESDLTLAELAAVTGLSAPHFTTLFRRTFGQSAHAYVMERRVCRARDLLLAGRTSIAQAAVASGFAHPSHLARWTRRLLGRAPAELRRTAPTS